ncbi:MAG TPA: pyrroline-5-carboxylate reductase [Verrucomicrobiae bacterium]|nr:pyrroline-5-carboxylate reductase [Verrucomicrobiae bacterium]
MKIGIVGCGTLGRAIAAGLSGHEGVQSIAGSTRRGLPIPELGGVPISSDNRAVARDADVVLLCVKPFQVEHVSRELAEVLRPEQLVICTAASVSTAQVRFWTSERVPVVRAMPNMPCRIGAGMTVLAAGEGATAEHVALAKSLFETLGRAIAIEERLMDAATGISGCGPAYAYVVIEALSDAGVKLGLSREVARVLVAQTILGSAKMVLESAAHPAALKDEVTTPAGCTIDALMELEDGKLRHTLLRAAVAAADRSATLASS